MLLETEPERRPELVEKQPSSAINFSESLAEKPFTGPKRLPPRD
jgi:hypothetical protein